MTLKLELQPGMWEPITSWTGRDEATMRKKATVCKVCMFGYVSDLLLLTCPGHVQARLRILMLRWMCTHFRHPPEVTNIRCLAKVSLDGLQYEALRGQLVVHSTKLELSSRGLAVRLPVWAVEFLARR